VTREERFSATQKALDCFDHENQDLHDTEINEKADIALVKMMVFLEFKTGFRREPMVADISSITTEISTAYQALEMIYRASSKYVETSFNRIGIDVLQLIVTMIDEEIKRRMKIFSPNASPESGLVRNEEQDDEKDPNSEGPDSQSVTPPNVNIWNNENYDGDVMIKKATKVLGHFARVGRATKAIAHFPGLLGSMLNLINMGPYGAVPWEARLSSLWTIANLACNTENMVMMMAIPNLMNALISVGFQSIEESQSLERTMEVLRARSIASRALFNLSCPPQSKISMAENPALVEVLCQLATQRKPPRQYGKSRTMQDIMLQTRRHSIGALRNLARAPRRSKIILCGYSNGKILDYLTEVIVNENDQRAIDLAFATVHNLAVHDTAEMMVAREALVLALKNALVTESECGDQAKSPPSHASSTLLVLERSITPDMPSYASLRELLDTINPAYSSGEAEEEEASLINTAAV
jgi:hypothetical protein